MVPELDKLVRHLHGKWNKVFTLGDSSWNGISTKQEEKEIVRSYLLGNKVGVDYLNHNLSPLLSTGGYEVKFASVYIHGKPIIKRTTASIGICAGDTPGCEIGDLLVVFCLLDANKTPLYQSAVLAQAKKDEKLTSVSQQCFYDSDVTFDMPDRVVRHSTNPKPRRILPDYSQGRTKGLHYLVIKPHPHLRLVPWDIDVTTDWGLFLGQMLCGDMGLPFTKPIAGETGWNCIVDDIINVGNGKIRSSIPRGSSLINLVNVFNSFEEYDHYALELEEEWGVPILFIIVKDNESQISHRN